jgi:adenylate cyclase
MQTEIERKFLVDPARLGELPGFDDITQGYLATDPTVRVRLRILPSGEKAGELTIKGPGLVERPEFNYPIPPGDALQLLTLCSKILRKRRYVLGRWELDFFPDRGLWLAEIELHTRDEPFSHPTWLGLDVSENPAYQNSNLARPPEAGETLLKDLQG